METGEYRDHKQVWIKMNQDQRRIKIKEESRQKKNQDKRRIKIKEALLGQAGGSVPQPGSSDGPKTGVPCRSEDRK